VLSSVTVKSKVVIDESDEKGVDGVDLYVNGELRKEKTRNGGEFVLDNLPMGECRLRLATKNVDFEEKVVNVDLSARFLATGAVRTLRG